MAKEQQTYPRFTLSQRLEHWVMTLSFIVLSITGLPQRYPLSFWADPVLGVFGGIEPARLIHRGAATVFILISIYHFVATGYRIYVRRVRLSMLPSFQDAVDMVNSIRYNLRLTRQHPKLPRFNFAEKMEYWSIIWGGVLMTITGLMLWNPIATTRFLPGEYIPAAKAAHSAEALLAVLAIIIWHFYFVHFKKFNQAMFTGRMPRQHMVEEHGAELAEIEAGVVSTPPVPPAVRQRRRQLFIPVAAVILLVGAIGTYFFITFEQTAITTLPPAEIAQAFVPATPTTIPTAFPTPTPRPSPTPGPGGFVAAAPVDSPAIPHPIEGQENCLMCHALETISPFPENHVNWPETTCLGCHARAGEAPLLPASVIPHPVEGQENCLMCHALNKLPENHQVAQFTNDTCLGCHTQEGEAAVEPEDAQEPAAEAEAAAGGPSAIPHPIEGREDCLQCHPMNNLPESHQAAEFTNEQCLDCHQLESGQGEAAPAEEEAEAPAAATALRAADIPHPTEGAMEKCLLCHALEAKNPFPENHANWPESTCLGCHAPAGQEPPLASPPITHPVEGQENCLQCHPLGNLPENHQEAEFTNRECLFCHSTQEAGSQATPEPEQEEEREEDEE